MCAASSGPQGNSVCCDRLGEPRTVAINRFAARTQEQKRIWGEDIRICSTQPDRVVAHCGGSRRSIDEALRRRACTGGSTLLRRSWRSWGRLDPSEPRQRPTRLITRDFRLPRRPDFGGSASVAYEFVHFGLGNREPETFWGARSLDARRDNPARPRRGSARHPATPLRWPTPRDLRARNPLSQNAVRTPQNANAPAVWPGRSL